MESSLKQEFTRRISQCNRGELVIIMYDICFAYIDDIKKAHAEEKYEDYKHAIKKAQDSIEALMKALDFKYEIAKELNRLYVYARTCLAKALFQNRLDNVLEAEKILKSLYTSFLEVAKTDTSGPLMRNTQRVYAGMTYGRNTLNESCYDNTHRGFLV